MPRTRAGIWLASGCLLAILAGWRSIPVPQNPQGKTPTPSSRATTSTPTPSSPLEPDWQAAIDKINATEKDMAIIWLTEILASHPGPVPWEKFVRSLNHEALRRVVFEKYLQRNPAAARQLLDRCIADGSAPPMWADTLPRLPADALAELKICHEPWRRKALAAAYLNELARTQPQEALRTWAREPWAQDWSADAAILTLVKSDPALALSELRQLPPELRKDSLWFALTRSLEDQSPAAISPLLTSLTSEESKKLDLPTRTMLTSDPAFWLAHPTHPPNAARLEAWGKDHAESAAKLLAGLTGDTFTAVLKGIARTPGTLPLERITEMIRSLSLDQQSAVLTAAQAQVNTFDDQAVVDYLNLFPDTGRTEAVASYLGKMDLADPGLAACFLHYYPDDAAGTLSTALLKSVLKDNWASPHDHMIYLEKLPNPALQARLLAQLAITQPKDRQHYTSWLGGSRLNANLVQQEIQKAATSSALRIEFGAERFQPEALAAAQRWIQETLTPTQP
jgi:hypothetical protein